MPRDFDTRGPAAVSVMPKFTGREARLAQHLPYVRLVDDRTVRTRGNEFFQCLRVTGLNSYTADDATLDKARAIFATVIAQAGAGFSFYVHKVSRAVDLTARPIGGRGFAGAVDERWSRHLAGCGLRDRTLTITIVKRPVGVSRVPLLRRLSGATLQVQAQTQVRQLDEVVKFLAQSFAGMDTRGLTASSGELLGFLEALNTGIELPTFPRGGDGAPSIVADDVANARISFKGGRVYVTGGSVSDRVGQIFAVKNYPRQTFCTMFDDLALPLDMVVTHSFTPVNSTVMADRIRRQIHMMRSAEDAAISLQQELVTAADDLASQRLIFGDPHMTVAVFTDTEAKLDTIAAEIRNIAAATGVKMLTEPYAARAHLFAQHSGNAALSRPPRRDHQHELRGYGGAAPHTLGKARRRPPGAPPLRFSRHRSSRRSGSCSMNAAGLRPS